MTDGNEVAQPRLPAALAGLPLVSIDVREELRAGREPFDLIMQSLATVPAGGAFGVRATFEPAPLYKVLGRRGLEHTTERLADDDWQVWFHPPLNGAEAGATTAAPAPVSTADAAADLAGADGVLVLDVRGLEPPEPMVRTLEALETLPEGGTLVQINVRVPQFLLPQLEQRGYTWEVREQGQELVRVFIRRAN